MSPSIRYIVDLAAVCPNAASTKVLVVRANGLAQRGSPLTSSFNLSTGNYVGRE